MTLSGIRVCHIASLSPGQNGTVAQIDLQQQYAPLYRNARAVVKSKNLLGERYLEINGVWEDHVRYAVTAEEWAQRREQILKEWIE